MITDSYLNYTDSDFSNKNQSNKYYNSSSNTANKPPLPSYSFNAADQQMNLNGGETNNNRKRIYTEETIIEILRGIF